MNYLAHAYLSFEDPEVLTGNMISDFVKGKKKYSYPPRIFEGIQLHRAIDAFTDAHETTRNAAEYFREAYGPYRLAFMDVVYDHFLAAELAARGDAFFSRLVQSFYLSIDQYEPLLPDTFRGLFPHMKQHNWLFNYQYPWGIEKSFGGLVHRARYISDARTAFRIFEKEYDRFHAAYNTFFPALLDFSLRKFSDIH